MTYRELLNRCQDRTGWVRTKENTEAESKIKYLTWIEKVNTEYEKQRTDKK